MALNILKCLTLKPSYTIGQKQIYDVRINLHGSQRSRMLEFSAGYGQPHRKCMTDVDEQDLLVYLPILLYLATPKSLDDNKIA